MSDEGAGALTNIPSYMRLLERAAQMRKSTGDRRRRCRNTAPSHCKVHHRVVPRHHVIASNFLSLSHCLIGFSAHRALIADSLSCPRPPLLRGPRPERYGANPFRVIATPRYAACNHGAAHHLYLTQAVRLSRGGQQAKFSHEQSAWRVHLNSIGSTQT